MYQGNNKTAVASQQAIANALIRLMKEGKYQSISISALCKEAEISRQTFYTLFDTKETVIDYILSKTHAFDAEQLCGCACSKIALHDLCRGYSEYIIEKQEFIGLLCENNMVSSISMSLYRSLIECDSFCSSGTMANREYVAAFVAGGLTGIARTYAKQDPRPDRDTLAAIIEELLTGTTCNQG